MFARSFDPVQDHYNYANEIARQQQEEAEIESEMQEYRTDFLERISYYVHPHYVEDFAAILAKGYENEIPEAEKLTKRLLLNQRHFAAFDYDHEKMKSLYK